MKLSKYKNSEFTSHAHLLSSAAYISSSISVPSMLSLPKFPLFSKHFIRRTSGHGVGNFRAVNFLLAL
jgi:hypothetical protein